MKTFEFNYEKSCDISNSELNSQYYRIEKAIGIANESLKTNYRTDFAFLNLIDDKKFLEESTELAKYFKNVELMVVIGIGGSNLGTKAIQEAVNPKAKILYADTVDADHLNEIIKEMNKCFKEKKDVLLNCISKSGNTAEILANFEVLLYVFKKARKDYKKFVVVTTDKNSKLWDLSKIEKFYLLEIPEKVIGRFSVFSNVSLFPLSLININTKKLLEGAKDIRKECLNKNLFKNPAALSALITYLQYRRGKSISNLFLFSNELESLGKWYRQLLAESTGKERDLIGRLVNAGLTPTVAIGTTDLHSQMQLYLGGSNDKVTSFVSLKNTQNKIKVPNIKQFSKIIKGIQGKDLQFIMNATYEGVKKSYLKKNLPFMEIRLQGKNEYCLGQFLQFKMLEVVYLAYLFNVNPFDQPDIEEYKEETRKILK